MCGIAGYILQSPVKGNGREISGLISGIRQRGPDDEGICLIHRSSETVSHLSTDRTCRPARARSRPLSDETPLHDVGFLHARFAIIDRSAGGHQPFVSGDGRCVLIFNGEIYNYVELRDELRRKGVRFQTDSDTEVLAEGWRVWKNELWRRLNGFWAAAIYDLGDRSVVLCRDRLGVAPLYYIETRKGIFFSSLIAPLLKLEEGADRINLDSIKGYLRTGIKDHDNTTCYQRIFSVPPAASITFRGEAPAAFLAAEIRQYWHYPRRPFSVTDLSFDSAVKELRDTLRDSVRLRLRADVPVAFELSGGLDSSSVIALAAEQSDKPLVAYTVKVKGRDETPFAAAMARRYRLDHRVIENLENDFHLQAEWFSGVMEEPYDTPANYLHHLMLKRIKGDGFQVILTGAGGDEALAGYEASFWPAARRQLRKSGMAGLLHADWYEFRRRFKTMAEARVTFRNYLKRFQGKRDTLFSKIGCPPFHRAGEYAASYRKKDFFEQRLFHCQVALLPYYLRSTDHYTMNIPLEHRFPFLDYRIVELGLKLPPSYLFQSGWTKHVLRQAMKDHLPSKVLWRRKKMGFPFDFEGYFQGRQERFEKYLKILESRGLTGEDDTVYLQLAKKDPVRLWRLLSVGIWLETFGRPFDRETGRLEGRLS